MNKTEKATLWIGAMRYYFGRKTYSVSMFCEALIKYWPSFDDDLQHLIKTEVDAEITAHRESTSEFKPLGMDMDYREWLKVQKLWS